MTPLFFNTFSTIVSLSQKSNHKIITLVAKMVEDNFLEKGNEEKKEKNYTFILQHLQHYPKNQTTKSYHKKLDKKNEKKINKNGQKISNNSCSKMTEDNFFKKGNQEKKEKNDTFIFQHLQHYRQPVPKIKPQNHNSCSENDIR